MKHRFLSLVLAVLLAAAAPYANAQEDPPFAAVRAYEEQFSDVSTSDWYYESVRAVYELGLINGQGSDSLFAPEGEMTVAEALTMAARLRSLYELGDCEAGPASYSGGVWYMPYVSYLCALGAIGTEFENCYEQKTTRAQMAHILANALPEQLFSPINEEAVEGCYASRFYIRDVRAGTPYQQDILTLYKWGILSGMDRKGSFHPEETIPRCQVAGMVARLAYDDLRIRLDWDPAAARRLEGTVMADLVYSSGEFCSAPSLERPSEIDADLRYMLSRGERTISLSYPPDTLTQETVSGLLEAFLNAVRGFVEQTYNEVRCSYSIHAGTVVFTFGSNLYEEEMIEHYREATMEYAIAVHNQLWEEKAITPEMTEYDKARVYFTWICDHCRYDFDGAGKNDSMSHSGYEAFTNGLAVCDGYTAAYNLLLKLEGISCSTVSAADHIWSTAELDGTTYHIDTTWGDQENATVYRYFAMTPADSLARFA